MKHIHTFESFVNESQKEVEGRQVGSMIKSSQPGVKVSFDDKTYTCKGSGKWEGPEGEKLSWVEVASLTSALGDKKVLLEK